MSCPTKLTGLREHAGKGSLRPRDADGENTPKQHRGVSGITNTLSRMNVVFSEMSYLIIGGGAPALDTIATPSSLINERAFVISIAAAASVSMTSSARSA